MKTEIITKEHQVIILPTDKATILWMDDDRDIFLHDIDFISRKGTNQHLYFISDEPIKEGDWILYNIHSNDVFQGYNKYDEKTIVTKYASAVHQNIRYCKKIIATTNTDLWNITSKPVRLGTKSLATYIEIAKIGIEFIEAYVKEQGKIDKILLEYSTAFVAGNYMNKCSICKQEFYNTDKLGFVCPNHSFLKLKPNGSVIIHPVKEKMYSKEEVIKLMDVYACYCLEATDESEGTALKHPLDFL